MEYHVKSLAFSRSGEELILMDVDNEFPTVISIKPYDIYQSAAKRFAETIASNEGGARAPSSESASTPGSTPPHSDNALSLCNLGILTSANSSLSSTGNAQLVKTSTSLAVNVDSEGSTASVKLISLPRWDQLSSTEATVISPQTRQEKINIILSTPAKPSYSLAEDVRQGKSYLPLHVQKDQRALRLCNTELLESSGKLDRFCG
jgi:hypothetical protein